VKVIREVSDDQANFEGDGLVLLLWSSKHGV
jgi:hypothetical protein